MDWAGLTRPLSRKNGGSAMYIWQIKRLRQQLAIEDLVEKEAFYYYLGTAIIGALIYEAIANGPPTGAGAEPAATDYLDGILYVGFTIGGIIWCYLQNGGATGSDFLKRIVPIGWVMSWRYFALVIIFTAGLAAIRWQLTGETGRPEVESVWDVVVMNSLIMWLFWRMGIHMKWVADNTATPQPSEY